MKKRLIVVTALTVVALAILGSLRDPAKGSDIQLVRGIKPISSRVTPYSSFGKDRVERVYSLHMPYDEAVFAVEKELKSKGWSHDDYYEVSSFRNPKYDEWIIIGRGRLFDRVMAPTNSPGIGPTEVQMASLSADDMHGWVYITTVRAIDPIGGAAGRLRQKVLRNQEFYAIVAPLPKKGGTDQRVDIVAGSSRLEGEARLTSFRSKGE